MPSYTTIASQEDMNQLLASIAGFHDSMTKEIHLVNRGYVRPDKSMVMTHGYDAQVLIQSQWEPFAIELLFEGIKEIRLGDAGEYWGASGTVDHLETPAETWGIKMSFDNEFEILSEKLSYRVRQDWLGVKSFLKSEVPSTGMHPAFFLEEKWRQCSSCQEAWEEELDEIFSYCPNCDQLTEVQTGQPPGSTRPPSHFVAGPRKLAPSSPKSDKDPE